AGNEHPSGAHHAGGDRTGTPGGGEAECAGIGAASGHRAPAKKEVQSGDGEVAGHADGFAGGVTSMSVSRRNIVGGRFLRPLGASFWGTRRRLGAWMARVLRTACLAGTKPILGELLWHRGC